ncbi:hypothetical protein IMCC21224_111103 [Puniceibacterium sp. IMCC21224]|nr:hypothetical protein IMCC21224_111103 [Puniceibacterium sp. IMCC21224]
MPLHFDPGDAVQFDWSEDFAVLGGERTKLQVAHIKLSHSRAFVLRAYPIDSPVFKVKSGHVEKGGAEPWSDADAEKFLLCHREGTMARRWFLLAEATAGRVGDMHILGPLHEMTRNERLYIRFQPSKKGNRAIGTACLGVGR